MVDGEERAKRVAMGFGVGAALGASIGAWGGAFVCVRGACVCAAAAAAAPHFTCLTPGHPDACTPSGAVYGTYGAFKHKVRVWEGWCGSSRQSRARACASAFLHSSA